MLGPAAKKQRIDAASNTLRQPFKPPGASRSVTQLQSGSANTKDKHEIRADEAERQLGVADSTLLADASKDHAPHDGLAGASSSPPTKISHAMRTGYICS